MGPLAGLRGGWMQTPDGNAVKKSDKPQSFAIATPLKGNIKKA